LPNEIVQGNFRERTDICLSCPRGCEIRTILGPEDEILEINGNKCKLGIKYVEQEIKDPRRVLPTSVRVRNGIRSLVPVWTPEPMPKNLLLQLAAETRSIEIEAPVHVGDVILEDWRGLGIRLVASGDVPRSDTSPPAGTLRTTHPFR
jgi:CxxC motif-containing protein